jgi:serine/threonine protein kinase
LISQTIRGYEILEEIATGGYGAVYRAHEASVNRDVAIKVILPRHADKPEFKQRFESEARLIAQLEHPHIVPLYSYWHDEDGAFLVMRLIRGGSLRQLLQKQGALSLAQTTRLLDQLAEALSVAHEAGVIHRDLKPENILIDQRGNAYLTDFGIAKQVDDLSTNITETDAIVGTMAYLSPEQVQSQPVVPQSDIYSLGIMLYEMLAGQHPFAGTPAGMMLVKHLQETLPDVQATRPDLPDDVDLVLQRATAKDPHERFATANDLLAAFHQALHDATFIPEQRPRAEVAKRTTPTTVEQRNRQAMLQNVRKFWIEGVLENSLHGAALIELGMQQKSGTVENPWDTMLRTTDGHEERLPDDIRILDIFERMNGKLLILGDPGGGKTTSLLTLARDLLQRAEMDEHHPLPIIFNLSSWGESRTTLEQWLADELSSKYQVPRKVAEEWVANDGLLLLLDGLDEVVNDHRNACVQAINTYRSEHGFVDVVVCSRIRDYEALSQQLRLNGAIVIQPLDQAQIDAYLNRIGAEMATLRTMLAQDEQLAELSRIPLMLSIMALAYRDASTGTLPTFEDVQQQRKQLFDVFVRRMFERQKGKSSYTSQETVHYLRWLARQMQQHGLSLFQIEQLQPSWLNAIQRSEYFRWVWIICILGFITFNGLPYYFGAPGIGMPPLTMTILNGVAGIAIALTILTVQRYYWISPIIVGLVGGFAWGYSAVQGYGITIAIALSITIGLIYGAINLVFKLSLYQSHSTPTNIPVIEQLRFSRDKVSPLMAIPGIITGCLWILAGQGWAYDIRTLPLTTVVGAVVATGLMFALVFLFQSGLTVATITTRTRPNQGMHSSLTIALQAGFATFLVATCACLLGVMPLASPPMALSLVAATAPPLLWGLWFVYGGYSVLRHVILRSVLERAGSIPLNLASFLDHAASLIMLRKVGGGYIFIHRYLLEYFAGLDETVD